MMKPRYILALPFLMLASCSPCVSPEGEPETRTLMLEKIESVNLRSPGTVRLIQGPDQQVEITAPPNIQELVNKEVQNGMWEIFYDPCVNDNEVVYTITLPDLKEIIVSGSGSVTGDGYFNTGHVRLQIDGSGNISATINAAEVNSIISGSGEINLAGSTNVHTIDISGSGEVDARDFITRNAEVLITGSGNVNINVKEKLTGRISGSGDISYYGSPASVQTDVQGSGEVIKK